MDYFDKERKKPVDTFNKMMLTNEERVLFVLLKFPNWEHTVYDMVENAASVGIEINLRQSSMSFSSLQKRGIIKSQVLNRFSHYSINTDRGVWYELPDNPTDKDILKALIHLQNK